jgi:hypothetical protein
MCPFFQIEKKILTQEKGEFFLRCDTKKGHHSMHLPNVSKCQCVCVLMC